MSALPARPVDPLVALQLRVAILEKAHSELAKVVDALRRKTGPRDDLDRALVGAIHDSIGAVPWRCGDLLERADHDPALRAALRDVEVGSSKQLGKLMARLEGVEVDGLLVSRVIVKGKPHWSVSAI